MNKALKSLIRYIETEGFQGYDPYDTLNSWIPFKFLGKWPAAIATQIQKRNPINIRPLLGIKKGINPKAYGLFLQAYSILYKKTNKKEYLEKADYFFNWLKDNYSKGYSGYCWGYNFPWANPKHFYDSYIPSSVVTGFVCNGIFEYYKINNSSRVKDVLISASNFVLKDLNQFENDTGVCLSYTPMDNDICYNASLLAGEALALNYYFTKDKKYKEIIKKILDFVIARQHDNGKWDYSYDKELKKEREQIDFHQGFVLCSIDNIIQYAGLDQEKYIKYVKKGVEFYYKEQFFTDGRSKWRLPKIWPVEIHNQAQGIITFLQLSYLNSEYKNFATKIADWTIKNMQDKKGFFYYQKHKFYTNKISYMRWSQAWMMLGFAKFFEYS